MGSEIKKISFAFSKIAKKTNNITQPPKIEKAELIDCLEGSQIKVKNPVVIIEKKPLVIAIKGNPNNLLGRIQTEALKHKNQKQDEEEDTRPDSELTIEELAARQLIREAREKLAQKKETTKVHTLPLEETLTATDAQESTMDDYENVPINDYGMAMLRGMGWKEGMCIGKNQSKFVKPPDPELRPKGLGLGAQKMVQAEPEDVFDKNGKQLVLAKGAFAKITAGPHRGTFCEVQGLDDEAGRIIVKIHKSGDVLTLNELFVKPVTKEEYALGSKVINNAKYERYKENEMKGKNSGNSNSEEERSKHGDGKHGFSENRKSVSKDLKNRNSRHNVKCESEDSSDEYARRSRREMKEESDVSTDEYRRNKTNGKCSKSEKNRKHSKSRYRSKDKDKNERRRHSSSESSSDERHYSKSSKHHKRRDSEDSNDNKSKSRSRRNKSKNYKHKKRNRSRNDSRSD